MTRSVLKNLNVFSEFRKAKDYLGLIYADANSMGRKLDDLSTLQEIKDFAKKSMKLSIGQCVRLSVISCP